MVNLCLFSIWKKKKTKYSYYLVGRSVCTDHCGFLELTIVYSVDHFGRSHLDV